MISINSEDEGKFDIKPSISRPAIKLSFAKANYETIHMILKNLEKKNEPESFLF